MYISIIFQAEFFMPYSCTETDCDQRPLCKMVNEHVRIKHEDYVAILHGFSSLPYNVLSQKIEKVSRLSSQSETHLYLKKVMEISDSCPLITKEEA